MKLAILGLGFMGSTHAKALGAVPGVELAAVFSRDEKKLAGDLTGVRGNLGGRGEMADFAGVRKYREVEALLADPKIEAVDICLPTFLHEEAAIGAMRAGKHVLVEKPMALDDWTAGRMLSHAAKHSRVLMTAHVLRFWPAYVALRRAVEQGRWGAMRSAVFRRRCAAPGWGGWLRDPALSGGGAFDLLVHDADMCLHLFGKPEVLSATGCRDEAAGIDCLHAQLSYAGGSVVLITGGWHHPGAYPFSMEYTVTLEGGTIEWGGGERPPAMYPADGPAQVLECPDCDPYAAEIAYFAGCCGEGTAPALCPPRESAAAVSLMLLMLESRARNGQKLVCRV
ncbi:MAG: Gfo/Idh/MocA family oxidoreductase [Acidobacteriia bacterium]|nr:Gfo/Idh/MocA family oxidoreductase [Terriglobia bacterium]